MTDAPNADQEEAARRNFERRSQILGDAVARTLDVAGASVPLSIEALTFATSIFLTHLAQHDKGMAAVLANNLANALLALCDQLGVDLSGNENEPAGAPN